MSEERILRAMERYARQEIKAFTFYTPLSRGKYGTVMKCAQAEERGIVSAWGDVRLVCRKLRRERKDVTP